MSRQVGAHGDAVRLVRESAGTFSARSELGRRAGGIARCTGAAVPLTRIKRAAPAPCQRVGNEALRPRELTTLAVFSADRERVRACFVRMRALRERLRRSLAEPDRRAELSMGMSNDFELAIAEGVTVVRAGQRLFGPRPLPDSHCWPGAER